MAEMIRGEVMTPGAKAEAAATRAAKELERAFAVKFDEIEQRPTFGSILAEELEQRAAASENDKIAGVLREIATSIVAERRGKGLRETVMQLGVGAVSSFLVPTIRLEINAAIEAALEKAGPSVRELHEALSAEFGLGDGQK